MGIKKHISGYQGLELGRRLTTKQQPDGIIWIDGTLLHFDWSGRYLVLCICQSSWKPPSKTVIYWDFPDSPVVRTPCFYCRDHRFNPWSRN